jgi:hypothetical protein
MRLFLRVGTEVINFLSENLNYTYIEYHKKRRFHGKRLFL